MRRRQGQKGTLEQGRSARLWGSVSARWSAVSGYEGVSSSEERCDKFEGCGVGSGLDGGRPASALGGWRPALLLAGLYMTYGRPAHGSCLPHRDGSNHARVAPGSRSRSAVTRVGLAPVQLSVHIARRATCSRPGTIE